jgi:hypothetical protein
MWVVNATCRPLYPRKRKTATHSTGSCVDSNAGLNGYGKSRPNRDSNHKTSKTVANHYTYNAILASLNGFIACISHTIKDCTIERNFIWKKLGNYIHQNVPAVCSPYLQVLQ